MNLRNTDCPLWYGWASSHQLEVLIEERLTSPEQEGSLMGDGFKLELWHWLFLGSLGCQPTLQILDFLASIIMQINWKLLLCPTLCDPMDCTVHRILQARILEWVAFPFSRRSSQSRDQTRVSCTVGRFFISWTTREAQEYWGG